MYISLPVLAKLPVKGEGTLLSEQGGFLMRREMSPFDANIIGGCNHGRYFKKQRRI